MADDADSSYVVIEENANRPAPKGSKRNIAKLQRHGPKPAVRVNCRHPVKTSFKCGEVTQQDVVRFNGDCYQHTGKIDQDNMIARFLKVATKKPPTNGTPNTTNPKRKRDSCETSFFMKKESGEVVRVCKEFFLKMLGMGRTRIENIAKHCKDYSGLRVEKRGGDRIQNDFITRRTSVINFLKSLRARESHYDRKKTKKVYLPSEITSVKSLWSMYLKTNSADPVKYEYFRRIFRRKFRIGFGSPKTDSCSTCERLKNKLKVEVDPAIKQTLMTSQRIHRLRSNAFYEALSEKRDGLKTFCFDHQQNQVLPKIPDQLAYYSRQLYVYNFAVVENSKDGKLSRENVFIYTWNENDFAKNSSSCSSAVFHALKQTNMENIDTVRLVSDACGGQNKNCAFLYMAAHWLTKHAPINVKKVEFLFPVRGHSFLPCDRVFGVLEKALRKRERIYTPEEYLDFFAQQGTVRVADKDFPIWNFKECADLCMKKPLPIKILENKRFIITRGKSTKIRGEPNYKNDLNTACVVTKKGHNFARIPVYVPPGVIINDAKKTDIDKLLKEHIGDDWGTDERFSFLRSIVNGTDHHATTATCHDDEHDQSCTCLGEDVDFNTV